MEAKQESQKDGRAMKVLWMITERGEKSFWTRVGVGFVNRDGSVTLQIDAMPVGTSKLQLRDYTPKDADLGGAPDDMRSANNNGNGNGRGSRPSSGFAP